MVSTFTRNSPAREDEAGGTSPHWGIDHKFSLISRLQIAGDRDEAPTATPDCALDQRGNPQFTRVRCCRSVATQK